MDISLISDANLDLVYIKNGTPHCEKHGAMNKMTKDGIWRCITAVGYRKIVNGNSVSMKEIDNLCTAGCEQLKK